MSRQHERSAEGIMVTVWPGWPRSVEITDHRGRGMLLDMKQAQGLRYALNAALADAAADDAPSPAGEGGKP